MTQEIVYTSAPKGLKPGSRGFCTVQSTQGMSANLADQLEALGGYRHVYPPQDPQAHKNPVIHAHLKLSLGGRTRHVLSRVCDAGLDYTQRTNKLAHQVVLDQDELVAAGPAALLSTLMRERWDGKTCLLPAGKVVDSTVEPAVCRNWEQTTGDAGWGGALAGTAIGGNVRQAVIIFQPGTDMLALAAESLALLPPSLRWDVTFSTYFTQYPPGVECQWRCLLAGTREAQAAARLPHALVIDLTQPLGAPPEGLLVDAARDGQRVANLWSTSPPTVATTPATSAVTIAERPRPARDDASPKPPEPPGNAYEVEPHPPSRHAPPNLPINSSRRGARPASMTGWWVTLALLLILVVGGATASMVAWRQIPQQQVAREQEPRRQPPKQSERSEWQLAGEVSKADAKFDDRHVGSARMNPETSREVTSDEHSRPPKSESSHTDSDNPKTEVPKAEVPKTEVPAPQRPAPFVITLPPVPNKSVGSSDAKRDSEWVKLSDWRPNAEITKLHVDFHPSLGAGTNNQAAVSLVTKKYSGAPSTWSISFQQGKSNTPFGGEQEFARIRIDDGIEFQWLKIAETARAAQVLRFSALSLTINGERAPVVFHLREPDRIEPLLLLTRSDPIGFEKVLYTSGSDEAQLLSELSDSDIKIRQVRLEGGPEDLQMSLPVESNNQVRLDCRFDAMGADGPFVLTTQIVHKREAVFRVDVRVDFRDLVPPDFGSAKKGPQPIQLDLLKNLPNGFLNAIAFKEARLEVLKQNPKGPDTEKNRLEMEIKDLNTKIQRAHAIEESAVKLFQQSSPDLNFQLELEIPNSFDNFKPHRFVLATTSASEKTDVPLE